MRPKMYFGTAIAAGASGYLLKAAPEDELLAGVRAVAAGEVALAPSVSRMLVARTREPAPAPGPGPGPGPHQGPGPGPGPNHPAN